MSARPGYAEAPSAFWSAWGDGKAELDGYALRMPRYGEVRDGTLVLIYVTEDMSDSVRVKADPGRHPPSDVYPVLKLNAIRKFQTGIYDYSTMLSAFVRVDGGDGRGVGPLRKLSLSSQEWCGQVYHQVLVKDGPPPRLLSDSHSYFDGEADDSRQLEWTAGAMAEDELLLRLRTWPGRGDLLGPGERRSLPLLKSLLRVRLLHQPLSVGEAMIERRRDPETRKTPAGTFTVTTYVVTVPGDRATFHIELAPPYRVIHYAWDSGEEATLLGSTRLPYWQLNKGGGEAHLKELGLPIPTVRPPVQSPSPSSNQSPAKPSTPGRR